MKARDMLKNDYNKIISQEQIKKLRQRPRCRGEGEKVTELNNINLL